MLSPHAKSFEGVATGGDLATGGLLADGVGSGVAHASFEPHGSVSPKPANVLLLFDGAMAEVLGCGGAGAERLNAELRLIEGLEVF